MTSTIKEQAQKADVGKYIELFKLDATIHGAGVHCFVKSLDGTTGVTWRGQYYTPVYCKTSGFMLSANGTLPTPKIELADIGGTFAALALTYDDLIGSTLTRTRTLAEFLDGAENANENEYWPEDVFFIERKTLLNNKMIEWELSCPLDQQGAMLPARQALRDYCAWTYRYWTGSDFDHSKASCPYVGQNCFDKNGNLTTCDKDQCGKRLSDCKLRHGDNAPLPFGGFPAMRRY